MLPDEPPLEATSQARTLPALPLPLLTFSSSLALTYLSPVALSIFGTPPPGADARYFFQRGPHVLPDLSPARHLSSGLGRKLARLAEEHRELRWGQGTPLEYWTGTGVQRTPVRCEAVVTLTPPPSSSSYTASPSHADTPFDPESTFTILFLRNLPPLPTPRHSSLADAGAAIPKSVLQEGETEFSHAQNGLTEALRGTATRRATLAEGEAGRIIDSLPQICFTATVDGHIEYFNQQWYNYTGLTHWESFSIEDWLKVFHDADMPHAVACWEHSIATGKPFDVEYRIRGADGIWRWMVAKGRAIRDEAGSVTGWVSTITEVEELVRVRSDALQVKEHINAVLSGANIILLSVNRASIVTFFEGSTTAGVGPQQQEGVLIGQDLRTVWPDARLHEAVSKILDENLESVTLLTEIHSGELADKHSYRYRLVPLKGGAGAPDDLVTGCIIVAADVTQLVAAEEALQQASLERTQLMASETAAKEASRLKTEFVTNISHEIRTPIASIIGICEILLDDRTLGSAHRSLIEKSLRSGEILLDLVGMVLDLGKVEAGKLGIEHQPFHLVEAVADAGLFSVIARKKGVMFIEDVGEFHKGLLLGDRMRLRQVLANGLSNAVKFTKRGSITLRLRQEVENATQCVVVFQIVDTGIGIDATVLPTLFTPFRQADTSTARHYGGSGLGLVIAKNLVELMGGSVLLESVAGVGTTMTVRLPFDKAPAPVGSNGSAREGTPVQSLPGLVEVLPETKKRLRRQDVHILLAEDNDLIREIVTRTLIKMNFHVRAVRDGAAAIQAVAEEHYDLILMDGQMPGLDGYEATSQIRASPIPATRDIKIIALTASAIQGDKERCIAAGMNSYLAKPVRAKDLEAAIWAQLDPSSSAPISSPPLLF